MRALLLAAALIAGPAVAQDAPLRELSTDRPDKTESPITVDAGHVQVELDFATYTHDRAGAVRTDELSVVPINLKYGIGRDTDVQVIVEPYLRATERVAGARDRTDGFGDITVRLKQNLWGNDGGKTALALLPFVRLPTSRDGLGIDTVEFGLIVPLSIELSDAVGVGVMTEIDRVERADGAGHTAKFINSATASFALTDKLNLYTELYTERAARGGAGWIVTGDTGLTYALSDDVQLDAGTNIGLTRAADDVQLFVGLSRRF
ncbi:MAG: transporter [Pseudomonadota bacterium]